MPRTNYIHLKGYGNDVWRLHLDGKTNILGWLVGQVMRASKGKANPQDTRNLLQQALERERQQIS